MARVNPYVQQFSPHGESGGRRATGEDFGAGVAHAWGQVGDTMMNVAAKLQHMEDERQVAEAQVQVAAAKQEWLANFEERSKTATADQPMAKQMQQDMNEYFMNMRGNFKSRKAQEYVRLHGTQMTTSFFGQAINEDSKIFALDMRNKENQLFEMRSSELVKNPLGFVNEVAQMTAEFQNKTGIYAQRPDAGEEGIRAEERFRKQIKDLAWVAGQGIRQDPTLAAQFLQAVNPTSHAAKVQRGEADQPSYEGTTTVPSKRPGGNFNVGNIIAPGGKSFQSYNTPEEGVAAMVNLLHSKGYAGGGRNTVESIINRWAPPASKGGDNPDNAVSNYVKFVSNAVGVSPTDKLDMNNTATLEKMVAAMGKFEGRVKGLTSEQIRGGINLSLTKQFRGWNGTTDDRGEYAQEPTSVKIQESQPKLSTELPQVTPDMLPDRVRAIWEMMGAQHQLQFLNQLESDAMRLNTKAKQEINTVIKDHEAEASLTGGVKKPLSAEQFAAFGPEGQRRYQEYNGMLNAYSFVNTVKGMSLADREAIIEKEKPSGEITASQVFQYEFKKKVAEQDYKEMISDPTGYNIKNNLGMQPVKPIEPNGDFVSVRHDLRNRLEQVETNGRATGGNFTPYSKEEAAKYRQTFLNSMPDSQAAFLNHMYQGAKGKPHIFNAAVAQVFPDSPEIQVAARLYTQAGMMTVPSGGYDAPSIVQDMMKGNNFINKMPGESKQDGSGKATKGAMPPEDKMYEAFTNEVGTGLGPAGKFIDGIFEAVKSHYAGSYVVTKGDISGKLNEAAFKNSVKLVVGNKTRIGQSDVIAPWGMDESRFKDEFAQRAREQNQVIGSQFIIPGPNNTYKVQKFLVQGGPDFIVDFNKPIKTKDVPVFKEDAFNSPKTYTTREQEAASAYKNAIGGIF